MSNGMRLRVKPLLAARASRGTRAQLESHILQKRLHLAAAHVGAEELRGEIRDLMSLIENDGVGGSEQVTEPVLLECEIRQQQVVVHDDDVGIERLASRQHHVTAGDFRTAHPQATLAGGGDLRPQRVRVRQAAHFRQVTAPRG